MAQGIFLHEYNTGGKLYDGSVSVANNKLANKQYVIDNAALQSNNLSDLDNVETARTNLGVAIGSDVQAYSDRLGELASLTQSDGSFVVSDGSSFVFESGATARTSLGLGSIATQDASNVSISGGSVTGITDLAVADGGTGASNAADARSNLSAQESNARLDDISGLTASDGGFIVGDGSNFVVESAATARASLGVDAAGTDNSTDVTLATVSGNYLSLSGQEITASTVPVSLGGTGATTVAAAQQALDLEPSVDIMAYDAELAALAGLTSAANKLPMFSGSGTATVIDFLDEDDMSSNSATGVPSQQSVKAYVDGVRSGLDIKDSVRVASTGNIAGTYDSTYLTFTPSAVGVLSIDGVSTALNDRVLLKDQSTATQNGIYYISTAGSGSGGSYTFNSVSGAGLDITSVKKINENTTTLYFKSTHTYAYDSGQKLAYKSGVNGANVFAFTLDSALTAGTTSISATFDSTNSANYSGNEITGTGSLWAFGTLDASGTAAVLTRATDFNSSSEITAGAFTFCAEGTVNSDAGFVVTTNDSITLDTTSINFTQFSGAGQITAGTGLTKSGNTISATGTLADIAGLAVTDGGIIVGDGTNFVLESGSTARASLGAQASNSNLDDISGLAVTDGGIIVGDGSNFVLESGATARASLDAQQRNDILDDLAGLTQAADKGLMFDSASSATTFDLTAAGRALLDDASASAQRTTLGLGSIATQDSSSVSISGGSISGITDLAVADGGTGASDATTARTNLGVAIGSDVQAHGDILDDLSGLTQAANKGVYFDTATTAATFDLTSAARDLLDDADAAAMRATLGLVIGTDVAAADSSEMEVDTSEPSSIAIGDVSGMYVYDISSGSATVDLPSTATSGCLGKSVIFKIKSTVGSNASLTITPATNQTIDGETTIVLNQERQAIKLVISEEFSGSSPVQCWVVV